MPSVVVVNTPKVIMQDGYGNPPSFTRDDARGTNNLLITGPVEQGVAAPGTGAWPVKLTNSSGNAIGELFRTLYADPNGDRRTIHSGTTITSNGSTVLTWVGHAEWYLLINLKDAPTGSNPTIKFTIEQLDPIDQATIIADARVFDGYTFTAAGTGIIEVPELVSDTLKVSWTVTGSTPSWTNVNVTFCGHGPGNAIEGQADVGTIAEDPPVGVAGVDSNGAIQYLKVDEQGRLSVVAASGSATTAGFAFGDVPLSSVTTSVVRRTTYTEQSSDAQRSIVSANANDTSAGTGARTVKVIYYDSTGAGPYEETITMNGTSAVNTVATNICFIEKMEVVTVGSGGSNAGIISLKAGTGGGGATIGTIAAGDNLTFWAHHYVPINQTCHITSLSVTINGGGGLFFIKSFAIGVSNAVEKQISDVVRESAQGSTTTRSYGTPISVAGPARLTAYVTTEAGTTLTYRAAFDFYEE